MNQQVSAHRAADSERLTRAQHDGIVIMGTGGMASQLHEACAQLGIVVHAFITSSAMQAEHRGLPVHALAQVPAALLAKPIWIGIFNHGDSSDLVQLRRQCLASGFSDVLVPQQFYALVEAQMGWRYWLAPLHAYQQQHAAIAQGRELLGDAESIAVFDAILAFRTASELDEVLPRSTGPQYFPADLLPMLPSSTGVYLDGGAFDGDTVSLAVEQLSPEHILAFEPDPGNFQQLAKHVASINVPATLFPLGISDAVRFLRFRSDNGAGCAVDGTGDSQIQVVDLDSVVSKLPIDFVKLDIEGCEIEALHGARHLISTRKPFLAIAGYHRWDDLWKIPALIHTLNPGYTIKLRLHCANSFDAVFYAYNA
ncbi:FkbM family methyltransferase [Stenotrophomonas pigmentata]|uniref:FkbM family methyltransferase n=1 Tax=Stenotrophomonas pigmentata TaxID=3055080 RepID=UPI0026EF4EF5|nr:FkbM family methyltransferase [Stenotrophomonas sp. 610A2]